MKENNSAGFWALMVCLFLFALLFLSLGHEHKACGQDDGSYEEGPAWGYYQPDSGGGQPDEGYQPDEGSYQPPEGEDESYQPPSDNDSDGYDGYYTD